MDDGYSSFCLVASLALLCLATAAAASPAFYVGKNLTGGHGALAGGTAEEVSSHWLDIVPAADYDPDASIYVLSIKQWPYEAFTKLC
ncbi:hypothetical protein V5738_14115 [Salinisphaera sp. SPP-AMP-43]|uniref:hypothetical protein n=1 Tax=Salinisphaera sp. SPP-AMP-43 TaxID=3121288 RepID=UPI003C6E1568